MIQFVINQAKKIIVANEYEKKIFVELTDESKIEVVRNGINLDDMKSSVKFKKKYALDCNYFFVQSNCCYSANYDPVLRTKFMHLQR